MAAIVGVLTIAGAFTAATVIADTANTAKADTRASYNNSVITWLDSDYGVTVNVKSVRALLAGDSLVVDYQGADTMIETINRSDDDLAVRVTGGSCLGRWGAEPGWLPPATGVLLAVCFAFEHVREAVAALSSSGATFDAFPPHTYAVPRQPQKERAMAHHIQRPVFKGKFAGQEGYIQRADGHWVIDPSAGVWVHDPDISLTSDTQTGFENPADLTDYAKRGIEDFDDWIADPDRIPSVAPQWGTGFQPAAVARSDDEMRAEFIAVHHEQHLRDYGNPAVLAVIEPAFEAWSNRPENAVFKNSSSARFVSLYTSTGAAQALAAQQDARAGRRYEKWAAAPARHAFLNVDGSEAAPDDVRRIFGALEKMNATDKAVAFADLTDLRWNGVGVVSDKELTRFERDMNSYEVERNREEDRRREDRASMVRVRLPSPEYHFDDLVQDDELSDEEAELAEAEAELADMEKQQDLWRAEQALKATRRSEKSWLGRLFS